MPEGTMNQGIGASVRRKEDKKFITGKGRYTDDINRNGQLYAYFIRSDVAHANIKNINVNAAAPFILFLEDLLLGLSINGFTTITLITLFERNNSVKTLLFGRN